jgi:hypothetical protein
VKVALVLLALLVAGVASACSGRKDEPPASAPVDLPRGTVLGILWSADEAELRAFAPRTLTPRPGRIGLRHSGGAWSFSPDETKVAVSGGTPLEVRIVDARRPRLEGVVPLPRIPSRPPAEPAVIAVAWPNPRRVLALVEWGAWGHALLVVDPVEREIVARSSIDGALVAQARTHDGLAVLLAPAGRIGRPWLLVLDADGHPRSIALTGFSAGLETVDPRRAFARLQLPGLAVDADGRRALVVSATGKVAAIDLGTERVVYPTLHEPVSLLGRLRRWLEALAEAKASAGAERQAAWLGERFVAVSGMDHRVTNGRAEQAIPAGLTLIDTQDWTRRTLDEHASQFSFSAGTLLAYGIGGNSATQETTGMGLTAYGLDGEKRFHLFGNEPIYYVETAGPYAYVWRDGASPVAVDLRAGRVASRLDRYRGNDLPALVVP